MMINIITAPDFLHNENPNVLVVCPSYKNKQLLNQALLDIDVGMNLYLYEDEPDLEWLLNATGICDLIFCDVDNVPKNIKVLLGYIISLNKTFYLTNDNLIPYNMLNPNKIDNLDAFISKLRGLYG